MPEGGLSIDAPDRQRTFVAGAACLLASFALSYLPAFAGLMVGAVLALVAYAAARRSGPAASLLADPGQLRALGIALAGLVAIVGFLYGLGRFDEPIAPLFEEAWVLAFSLVALHVLSPDTIAPFAASVGIRKAYIAFFVLTVFVGCLIGEFSLQTVAWLAGFVLLAWGAGREGLLGGFAPQELWMPGWRRLTAAGLVLAVMALGLVWAQHSYYNPGYYDSDLGSFVDVWFSSYGINSHIYGLDLLPSALITFAASWLASPYGRSSGRKGQGVALAVLAVLLLFGLYASGGGQIGPDVFLLGILLAGAGLALDGRWAVQDAVPPSA